MTDWDLHTWRDSFPEMDFLADAAASMTSRRVLRACKTPEQLEARKHLLPAGLPANADVTGWNDLFRAHLGATLIARLYPYQKSAIARALQFDGRILLACAPGTGKTSMVTCCTIVLKLEIEQLLIICPSIAITPWCMELHNWAGMDARDVQYITTAVIPKPKVVRRKSAKKRKTVGGGGGGADGRMEEDDDDSPPPQPPPSSMFAVPASRIDRTKRVIITTFAIATTIVDELRQANFSGVVVDESHALKNENSLRSKAITSLLHQARYRFLMTGTPGDKIIQLYAIVHAVRPDLFPSYVEFGERWCDTKKIKLPNGTVKYEYVTPKDKSRLDELNALLYAQVMFRVGKEVLKGLPPKYRVRKLLDADTEEGKLALQEKLKTLAKNNGMLSEQDNAELDALAPTLASNKTTKKKRGTKRKSGDDERPAASHTLRGDDGETSLSVRSGGVCERPQVSHPQVSHPQAFHGRKPKFDAHGNVLPPTKLEIYGKMLQATLKLKLPYVLQSLKALIATGVHLREKVLLFAHHDRMLNFMGQVLEQEGFDYIRIDGKVTGVWRRGELCSKFQNDPACRFAVLSIGACSTAITLTAGSLVVFAEMVPNPSDLLQAGDRAHRIGQTKPVHVEFWLLRGSLDETLYRLVEAKEEQMNYLLTEK